jgi:hypothetical protein
MSVAVVPAAVRGGNKKPTRWSIVIHRKLGSDKLFQSLYV